MGFYKEAYDYPALTRSIVTSPSVQLNDFNEQAQVDECHYPTPGNGPGMQRLIDRVQALIAKHGFHTHHARDASNDQRCPFTSTVPNSNQRIGRQSQRRGESQPPSDDGESEDIQGKNARRVLFSPHDRLLACPFHRFKPYFYSYNSITGPRYSTCQNGFEDLRRLRYYFPSPLVRRYSWFPKTTSEGWTSPTKTSMSIMWQVLSGNEGLTAPLPGAGSM